MKDLINKIVLMSPPKKFLMLLGILVLTALAFYTIFLSSSYVEIEDLTSEVDRLELEVAKKKGIAANLKKYRKEVKELDIELVQALKELPDKKDIDSLLAKISDKARNSGLQVELFQPALEKYEDFYSIIPVELKVNGLFHQLAVFFNEIGDLDRIVNLKEFSINKSQGGEADKKAMLNATLTAVSFRFLDDDERKSREKKSKKKKK